MHRVLGWWHAACFAGGMFHSRTTRSLFLSLAFCAVAGCNPGDPGTTEDPTTGDNTTGTPTTGTPTTGTLPDTTTDATLTPTSGGESESQSSGIDSSTGDATSTGMVEDTTTGSTGEDTTTGSTGDDTSTTDDSDSSSGGSSTGDPVVPLAFDECREGDSTMCPAEDPACLVVDGPGGFSPNGSFFVTWSFCTRECDSDADCVSGVQGGTAKPVCVPKGQNNIKVCVLDCSFNKTCPEAMECSYDDTCGTRFCNCSGDLCDDDLCTGA